MRLTIESLKKATEAKGYKWYTDRPNIQGIRSSIDAPNVFNDLMAVSYPVPPMPSGLSTLKKQQFLNDWAFLGKNGKTLAEDGDYGTNTKFAEESHAKVMAEGGMVLKVWNWTTDPGTYWMTHPLSEYGAAILKPGQYVDVYQVGTHRKPDHRALVQRNGKVVVFRDNDKDVEKDMVGVEEQSGYFGINIHGANRGITSTQINKWSAGCQVAANWDDKEALIDICDNFKAYTKNKFTYTLFEEADLK